MGTGDGQVHTEPPSPLARAASLSHPSDSPELQSLCSLSVAPLPPAHALAPAPGLCLGFIKRDVTQSASPDKDESDMLPKQRMRLRHKWEVSLDSAARQRGG